MDTKHSDRVEKHRLGEGGQKWLRQLSLMIALIITRGRPTKWIKEP